MTPDKPKCEHGDKDELWIGPAEGTGEIRCHGCNQRFVPSDVLEEARKALSAIQWQAELGFWEEGGCSECGAHGIDVHNEPHKSGCIVGDALARIDGVLGQTPSASSPDGQPPKTG